MRNLEMATIETPFVAARSPFDGSFDAKIDRCVQRLKLPRNARKSA